MRLHRLVITGVGPFRERQEIDFDELTESGLFLIDGATGSGKTTIIDSIVYALFGVVSGGNDSDSSRIRSHYCAEEDPTGVTCEFSVDGRRHVISRVPAGARDPEAPGKAAASKPARQVLRELNADGSERTVLTKDREITEHVVGLLGMSAVQFSQLVVLPQGKFADLLTMTALERMTALSSLLGEDFFELVQADLQLQGMRAEAERRSAQDAVDVATQRIAGRLQNIAAATASLADFSDVDADDASRLASIDSLIADFVASAAEATAQRDALAQVAADATVHASATKAIAQALRDVSAAQSAVASAEAALSLEDAAASRSEIAARVGELRRLEGSLGEYAAWEADAPDRAREADALIARRDASTVDAERLRAERQSIPQARVDLEARRSGAEKAAAIAEAAEAEAVRLSGLLDRANELSELSPELDRLAEALAASEEAERALREEAAEARREWEALLAQQSTHRAAQLAMALESGSACPVCGSTEHPHPAQLSDDAQLVTDARVEAAKSSEGAASTAAAGAAEPTGDARRALQETEKQVAALRGALAELTHEAIAAQHEGAVARHAAAAEAREELDAIAADLTELSQRESLLDSEISELETAATQAAATIAANLAAATNRQVQISEVIGEAASATALLVTTRTRIAALTAVAESHSALDEVTAGVPADKRTLSPEDANNEAAKAAKTAETATAELDAATEMANSLSRAIEDTRPLRDAFASALTRRAEVVEQSRDAIALAALVSAKNNKNLHLRSYALQRRFESVLVAASTHLERMSSGKFSFELGEHSGRGSAGLGIAIRDAWTGQIQEPKSLSGGETFYASLALALGLADIVKSEAGGSSLETLFIDEGFGSLDQTTLYQVLDQLDEMRAGRRAVGVVSHVTEMKEAISNRIEVRRQADSTSTVLRDTRAGR